LVIVDAGGDGVVTIPANQAAGTQGFYRLEVP
jgi:hypothetical protein